MKIGFWLAGVIGAIALHLGVLWSWMELSDKPGLQGAPGEERFELALSSPTASISTPEPEPEPEPEPALSSNGIAGDTATQEASGDNKSSDNGDALGSYQEQLQSWIRRVHVYPSRARRRKLEGTALVEFELDDSGIVIATKLLQSSGESLLDKAALKSLRAASPMPAPPADVSERKFPVPLSFRLHD